MRRHRAAPGQKACGLKGVTFFQRNFAPPTCKTRQTIGPRRLSKIFFRAKKALKMLA
jgi:hypothetical protein